MTTRSDRLLRARNHAASDVTVVVPTFNRGGLLRKTLSSLVDQTVRCRIVVVDDASTDATPAVCSNFRPRVEYVRNESRRGLFANWNRGLELVGTEFVAIYHDDDLYHPDIVASEASLLRRSPDIVMAHSGCLFIDDDEQAFDAYVPAWPDVMSGEEFRRALAGRFSSPVAAPSAMLRTEAIRGIGGFEESLRVAGDLLAWVALAKYGNVGYVRRPLVAIRHRGRHANEHARFDWRIIDEHLRVARQTHADVLGPPGVAFQTRVDWYLSQFVLREVVTPSDDGMDDVVRQHGSLASRAFMRLVPRLGSLRRGLMAAKPLFRAALEAAGRVRRVGVSRGWDAPGFGAGGRRQAERELESWPASLGNPRLSGSADRSKRRGGQRNEPVDVDR